jgi:hypothetical protein
MFAVAVLTVTLCELPFREYFQTQKRVTGPTAPLFTVHFTPDCGPLAGRIKLELFALGLNAIAIFMKDKSGHGVIYQ